MWIAKHPHKQTVVKLGRYALRGLGLSLIGLVAATIIDFDPVAKDFTRITSSLQSASIKDRRGVPLTTTFQGAWNRTDLVELHRVPDLFKSAFIFSEDQHFYEHGGVDWRARVAAITQNMRRKQVVRGASTITEQVVRMMYPRPRHLWSKWMEGIEAIWLEQYVTKADILEFYLNQVPYASNRRGIAQAAQYYFNRDVSTLSQTEMLALVVMARAPSSYDLYKYPDKIDAAVTRLQDSLIKQGGVFPFEAAAMRPSQLTLQKPTHSIYAQHFARYVREHAPDAHATTLDASLQRQVQAMVDERLRTLQTQHVQNAGVLIADHHTGEIIAWVVAGAAEPLGSVAGGDIDTITTPRQPGSSMKPFLYAAAIQKGWNGATMLNDSPLAASVGTGLHRFRNYSNTYYGPITLREALGNSLNIPALLTIQYVGVGPYLSLLQNLGFQSLGRSSDVYDEGLALGNGEVTLLEMTNAYAALAQRGQYRSLRVTPDHHTREQAVPIYDSETTSIIAHILSDPWARRLEFGSDSVLNFPIQTAVKTGTSTDYRDAWVFGYNDRYVVGIWMGNLDRSPMKNVTGSTGPALLMRSIFARLNRDRETERLYLAPTLSFQDTCVRPPRNDEQPCQTRSELFRTNDTPVVLTTDHSADQSKITMVRPTEGLQIAYDPRIPAQSQKFRFELKGITAHQNVTWRLNGMVIAEATAGRYLWPVKRGKYSLEAVVHAVDDLGEARDIKVGPVTFVVK